MPSFEYQGRNSAGELIKGYLDGASAEAVAGQLAERGLTPLKIAEGKAPSEGGGELKLDELLKRKTVTTDELIIFSRQMYSLTKAGVPIVRALRGLAGSLATNPYFQDVIYDVADTLQSGVDLASAMNRHPKVFNDLYVSVIHVGENTGQLDQGFRQIAGYLELERETKKRIGSATRYPLFVLVAIAVAVTVINVFVIPAFANMFASFGADLPWQTRLLIGMSNFTVNNWYWIVLFIVGLVLAARYYVATKNGRLNWDRIKLRMPLVGGIFERITLGRFSRTFAIVTQAGLPIIQGLNVVGNAVGNAYVSSRIDEIRRSIERGDSFSRSAANSNLFTPLVLQMIAVGEETGQVDELLHEAADFYEEEVDFMLKRLADRMEPILLMVVAGMVLILALGVFLPMWDLSSAVKGG